MTHLEYFGTTNKPTSIFTLNTYSNDPVICKHDANAKLHVCCYKHCYRLKKFLEYHSQLILSEYNDVLFTIKMCEKKIY